MSQPTELTLSPDKEIVALRQRCAALEAELERLRHRDRRQLAVAETVHRSLLPAPIRHERIWIDVRYMPVANVGGDYCQVRFPDAHTCYITILDVTGHGVGAALLATRISSEVRHALLYRQEPRAIVGSLQRFLREYFANSELYASFVAARIDLERRELTWCGAGHPGPLVIRAPAREVQYLESQNLLLGLDGDGYRSQQDTVSLGAGDRLMFYTDGVFEVFNDQAEMLGIRGLTRIAHQSTGDDLFEMADRVLRKVNDYQHGTVDDDQTLIVAELR